LGELLRCQHANSLRLRILPNYHSQQCLSCLLYHCSLRRHLQQRHLSPELHQQFLLPPKQHLYQLRNIQHSLAHLHQQHHSRQLRHRILPQLIEWVCCLYHHPRKLYGLQLYTRLHHLRQLFLRVRQYL